ncbi:MAG: ABC transporter ATP-binding protein [Eubacteriales bacterium]|nr:ABC transporter ATP-binding protein [Eubacteriales bacterium]
MTSGNKTTDNRVLKEEEYRGRSFPLSWLFGYFIPYIPAILLSFILALVVNAAALAGPYLTKLIIDNHLVTRSGDITALVILAAAYLGAALLGAVTGYLQEILVTRVGQKIIHKMRTELFDKIQRLNMSFFDHNSSGRIFSRLTNDIDAMSEIVSVIMISVFVDGILIVGIIAAMFLLSAEVAAATLPIFPIIIISVFLYKLFIERTFIRSKAALARINGFLAENINGIGTIKLFGREKEKNEQFGVLTLRYFKLGLRQIMLHTFSNPYMNMLYSVATAFLLYIFAERIISGVIEIGVLYAVIVYLKRFFEPVIALIDQFTQIQSAFISGERIYAILKLDEEEDYETGIKITEPPKGEIEFKNVWFAYEKEHYVLRGLSFHAAAGSSMAFVGATGSGKSTIISLLCRFYEISQGEILLDGINIYDYNLRHLRHHIAVIQQEPFLFNGDIVSNVTLGNDEYDIDTIKQAAEVTGADTFIRSLPLRYRSEVAERGKTFSAGQRQLISFTRAAITTPSVFILDEATANIDTETELNIKNAVTAVSKDITRITVAHRLSTIKDSDCICVLQSGRIVESGTHDELIALNGLYKIFYMLS